MKRLCLSATLALCLLSFTLRPQAQAQDLGITPDKKLAKELTALADLCYDMGIKAKDRGIYNYAKSFFNHALMYDSEHKDTRKILGFKKKKGEWVADKDDYGMPRSNTVSREKEPEAYRKVWEDTREARSKAADKLYEFVADTTLETRQRILALHHLMLIDPWHEKGHRAAGLEAAKPGTSEDLWIHTLDSDYAHQRNAWVSGVPDAVMVSEKTPYEEALGLKFSKARGERFFFHVCMDTQAENIARNLTPYADATQRKAAELLGLDLGEVPKEDAKRLHYTFFQHRRDYAQFVDKCAGIDDPARKKEVAEQGWGYATRKPTGNVWLYSYPENDSALRDGIAHEIGSFTIAAKCGYRLYWLNRGMGFTLSNRAMGTCKSTFVAIRGTAIIDSGGVDAMPGLGTNAAAWRFKVILAIAGGKSLNLGELTKATVSGFSELHAAFGFCYTEYLLAKHKDKLAPFLEDAYKDSYERYQKKEKPETNEETLARLLKHLGTSQDSLQTEFALWATQNYMKLPKKE